MNLIILTLLLFLNLASDAQSVYDKQSVKAVMAKANRYRIENPWDLADDNWIRGTYYAGVMSCYKATGDTKYLRQCDSLGKALGWRIPSLPPDRGESGVNLLTIGQTWMESYLIRKDKDKISPLVKHLSDPEIKNAISNPLEWYFEDGRRYVDGLFTGPPALAMLYSITGDNKYLQWMESCFWDIYGALYDMEENLFYRDHRFFPDCIEERRIDPGWKGNNNVTANGKKVIWSRGNGWAFAGITRILKYLPQDHPSYERYLLVFKNMSSSLKERQSEEGFWYPNLADPDHVDLKETSGTCFFVYGLGYGINSGILDRAEYLPVVEKGWRSVYEAVSPEGKVLWGQMVGDRPVMIQKEDSHEFVTGTFLLAASEVYKIKK